MDHHQIANKIKDKFRNHRQIANIVIIVVAIIAVTVMVFSVKYGLTKCQNKKPFIRYLLGLNVFDVCEHMPYGSSPNGHTQRDPEHPTLNYLEREVFDKDEVFHINDQKYTYEQAKCKCSSYGAKLATYEQMVKAYNKGADWCSYGWNQGQRAYYPTQKCTWDKLQKGPKHLRNTCGFAGINGGYFANDKLKFGVNCWGVKPKGEVVQMKKPVCKGEEYCKLDDVRDKVSKSEDDRISGFNKREWSMY